MCAGLADKEKLVRLLLTKKRGGRGGEIVFIRHFHFVFSPPLLISSISKISKAINTATDEKKKKKIRDTV